MVKELIADAVKSALPEGWMPKSGVRLPGQSDRQFRRRRSGRRLRPDRPQDHRRHLRRLCAARRRRVLRQGPDQGRPLGGLCGALSRQERRRGRPRRALHHPDRLCDRRRRPDVALGRHPRHRQGRRGQAREGAAARFSRCGRPTSAARSSSTGRSTGAPRPTAISAARRTRTAASPGRGPTSPQIKARSSTARLRL